MGRKKVVHRNFDIREYPRSVANKEKVVIEESFAEIRGDAFLRRVYFDGSGELVRYCDESEMWSIIVFPPVAKEGTEEKIRRSIRNNFDVGVCLRNDTAKKIV